MWALSLAIALDASVASSEAFVPKSDDYVLERGVVSRSELSELGQLRERMGANTRSLDIALELAGRYRELARTTGDARYLGYAQAALASWWELPEPPASVRVLRALVREGQHDFGAALEDVRAVLASEPANAQAWLTKSVIERVLGDPRASLASCQMLRRLASPLVGTTCESQALRLLGGAERSYSALERSLARSAGAPVAIRAYALGVLGDIAAQLGRYRAAEDHYRTRLALGENVPALASFADFLLARGRADEAHALLRRYAHVDGLLLRLALAEKGQDGPDLARLRASLQARFDADAQRAGRRHLRDEARFQLELVGDAPAALAIASRAWHERSEPEDARLLIAASLAAGDPSAAAPALEWLEATGLADVRLDALRAQLLLAAP